MKISASALTEIEQALEKYEEQVNAANIRITTKSTYLLHADNFVRWLRGEFQPESRKSAKR